MPWMASSHPAESVPNAFRPAGTANPPVPAGAAPHGVEHAQRKGTSPGSDGIQSRPLCRLWRRLRRPIGSVARLFTNGCPNMSVFMQREIERLKKEVLKLGALAEESLQLAAKAVTERDEESAALAMERDWAIDRAEVEVEEECLKILALHQPVAADLRFIVAVLKINNDLERVGDMAVNIARSANVLACHPAMDLRFDIAEMADRARTMLRHALDAVVNLDAETMRQVREADDQVDILDETVAEKVAESIKRNPDKAEPLLHFLAISRHFERVADLASNIAEDVIYMVEGQIVRHTQE